MLPTPRSVAISLALLWSVAHWLQAQTVPAPTSVAENFQTIYGKEYKDATVTRVEPDGIVLTTKSGISKVYFTELPKEVQQRFHYDPGQAAEFTTATQTAISQSNAVIAAQQEAVATEQRRKAEIQRQAVEQQRQAIERQAQIAAQQEQRQLEAQQKQDAKIAAQKQARQQQQRRRRVDARARAIEEDVRGQREAQREDIRYKISAIELERSVKPLSKEEEQRLRTLESQRDSIPH
jgi:hypothetical protein